MGGGGESYMRIDIEYLTGKKESYRKFKESYILPFTESLLILYDTIQYDIKLENVKNIIIEREK